MEAHSYKVECSPVVCAENRIVAGLHICDRVRNEDEGDGSIVSVRDRCVRVPRPGRIQIRVNSPIPGFSMKVLQWSLGLAKSPLTVRCSPMS